MHCAGSDYFATTEFIGDVLQERISALDGDRPGGDQNGIDLEIGKADGRHGDGLLGLRAERCRARIRGQFDARFLRSLSPRAALAAGGSLFGFTEAKRCRRAR